MDRYKNKKYKFCIGKQCKMTNEHIANMWDPNRIHDTTTQSSNLKSSMKLLKICLDYYKLYEVHPLSQSIQSL